MAMQALDHGQRRRKRAGTQRQVSHYAMPTSSLKANVNFPAYPFASLLYTDPSFLRGAASVLDVGGTLSTFNYSLTPWQADYFALLADHRAIAADYQQVASEFFRSRQRRRNEW